jgi:hypothetical protein
MNPTWAREAITYSDFPAVTVTQAPYQIAGLRHPPRGPKVAVAVAVQDAFGWALMTRTPRGTKTVDRRYTRADASYAVAALADRWRPMSPGPASDAATPASSTAPRARTPRKAVA